MRSFAPLGAFLLALSATFTSSAATAQIPNGWTDVSPGFIESFGGQVVYLPKSLLMTANDDGQSLVMVARERSNDGICSLLNLGNSVHGGLAFHYRNRAGVYGPQNAVAVYSKNQRQIQAPLPPLNEWHTITLTLGKNDSPKLWVDGVLSPDTEAYRGSLGWLPLAPLTTTGNGRGQHTLNGNSGRKCELDLAVLAISTHRASDTEAMLALTWAKNQAFAKGIDVGGGAPDPDPDPDPCPCASGN